MSKAAALTLVASLLAGCTRAAPPSVLLPPDTGRDFDCVLRHLSEEKKYDEVKQACGLEDKNLVCMLVLIDDSKSLMDIRADVSVQASIVLHEKMRHDETVAPGKKVR